MSWSPSRPKRMAYSIFDKVRRRIAEDCGWTCHYCGITVLVSWNACGRLATIDHKTPLSRGGTWKRYNLTCACRSCNSDKGDMTAEEYFEWRREVASQIF